VTRDEYAQFVAETNRPDPDRCITVNASGTGFIATNGNCILQGSADRKRPRRLCELGRCAGLCGLAERQDRHSTITNGAEWNTRRARERRRRRYGSDNPAELCRYSNVVIWIIVSSILAIAG